MLFRSLDIGWIWEADDMPVAMCGYAPPVGDPGDVVGRIGPVFTVAEHRGRGFGAAVTTAAIEELSKHCDHIMLYADASNPASNSVYQRLGFEEHARTGQAVFSYD